MPDLAAYNGSQPAILIIHHREDDFLASDTIPTNLSEGSVTRTRSPGSCAEAQFGATIPHAVPPIMASTNLLHADPRGHGLSRAVLGDAEALS